MYNHSFKLVRIWVLWLGITSPAYSQKINLEKPKASAPAPKTSGGVKKTAAKPVSYASLLINSDLEVHITLNGEQRIVVPAYTVRKIGLDQGLNLLEVSPADGGNDGYTERITVNDRGNKELSIQLGSQREAIRKERDRNKEIDKLQRTAEEQQHRSASQPKPNVHSESDILKKLNPVGGQGECFYWVNGNSFPFRFVEADSYELKYEERKGSLSWRRAIDRENAVVAFNANGLYLLTESLPSDPEEARNTLRKFYSTPGPGTDILIKASPTMVIEATIRVEDDISVNYLDERGQPNSINKDSLAAIIYRDGRHRLLKDAWEAKSTLTSALPLVMEIAKRKSTPSKFQ